MYQHKYSTRKITNLSMSELENKQQRSQLKQTTSWFLNLSGRLGFIETEGKNSAVRFDIQYDNIFTRSVWAQRKYIFLL